MANTFVQGTGTAANQSGTSFTLAYVSNVTAGNLLVTQFRYNGGGVQRLTSITDTIGNTWTIVYDTSDSGATPVQGGWAWAIAKSSGANTLTFNLSASIIGGSAAIGEWNGANTLRASSTAKQFSQVGAGTVTSNTITATAGDLLLGFEEINAANTTATAGTGFTMRAQGVSGATPSFTSIEDNLSSAGGTVSSSFSINQNSNGVIGAAAFFATATTHSISGNAGVAGATVSYSGTSSGNVTADGSGNYTISGLSDGPYTITPSLTGWTFTPSSSNQTLAGSNITGVNFSASQTQVATSTFSPAAGTYSSAQSVSLNNVNSGLAGFAQYYTTDGSTPTTGSTLYTSPISVNISQTIKVLAVATSFANSNIASAGYTITTGGTPYSVPDCRVAPFGPNSSRNVNGTLIYDVQTTSNIGGAPVDSRVAVPVACGTYPQNSRTPGIFGPGE